MTMIPHCLKYAMRCTNMKLRHIDPQHNYMRQLIESSIIKVLYVKKSRILVNPLTKRFPRDLVTTTMRVMLLNPQLKRLVMET